MYTGGCHIRSRRSEQHRRTILELLETTAATPARPISQQSSDVEEDLDFDWRPAPLQRAVDSDRTFRWPIVIASLFIGVAVALVIRLFIAAPADTAFARLDEYRAVAARLDEALRTALDAPVGDSAAAATLSDAIAAVRETIEQPLPSGVPLIGQGPGADLDAAHQTLTAMADAAATLVGRLAVARSYQTVADEVLTLPLLPTEVSEELLDSAARTVFEYQASATAAAAALRDDPEFTDLRAMIDGILDDLPGWSDRYLLALRRGETETTGNLVRDLRQRTDLARVELNTRLNTLDNTITSEGLGLLTALQQSGLVDP